MNNVNLELVLNKYYHYLRCYVTYKKGTRTNKLWIKY
jgi:hypothetical protein